MIAEVLGTDVANYFATNGIDSNDLGGSARSVAVNAPSTFL